MNAVVVFVRLSALAEADLDSVLAALDEDARARVLAGASEKSRKESLAARGCLSVANALYRERFSGGRPLKIDRFSAIGEKDGVLTAEWNGSAAVAGNGDFVTGSERAVMEERGVPAFLAGSFTRLASGLFANLSHTDGVAVAAVSDCPVGVDVQKVRAVSAAVKNRVCAEAERAEIAASPDPDRAFAEMWTKKESYVKSLGQGIATDLSALNFACDAPQLAGVRFSCGAFCGAPYAVCLRERK